MDRPEPTTLTNNFWARIATLCLLYVAQGLPFGFVTIALKNYLISRGVTVGDTGAMIAMISWPWALKFFWGPVIDRFGIPSMGRRRPWLIFAQGSAAIILFGLALIPGLESNIHALGWAILVVNVFLSLQDVATDALAVDLLSEKERGKVNGFMYGGSCFGNFVGGAFVGYFLTREGGSLQVALFVQGVVILAIMFLPLLFRERSGEKRLPWSEGSSQLAAEESGAESVASLFQLLFNAFSQPVAIFAAIFAFLVLIGYGILAVVGSKFFIDELGWTDVSYSNLESYSIWLSLLGSIAGGFIADRIGAKSSLIISGVLMGFIWIAFRYTYPMCNATEEVPYAPFAIAFTFAQAAFVGLMTVSSFSLFMGVANKRVAATQFTAYMSILNLSNGMGGRIAGWADELVPHVPDLFLYAGVFHLAVMLFVLFCIHPPKQVGV